MYPVPTIAELSAFSGRDQATYTGYANSALLQATMRFTFLTEISDPSQVTGWNTLTVADMQQLALNAICALADSIYLQFPYQQAMASPLNSETLGSYSFQKSAQMGSGGSMSRMAPAALELSMDTTGIPLFDMAVQIMALRTITSGVWSGGVTVFENGERKRRMGAFVEDRDGRRHVLGPEDFDNVEGLFSVNSQVFPMDPGV